MEGFYTPKELADLAGVHVSYIRQLLQAEKLEGVKVGLGKRGIWIISHVVGNKWLEDRKSKPVV